MVTDTAEAKEKEKLGKRGRQKDAQKRGGKKEKREEKDKKLMEGKYLQKKREEKEKRKVG